MKSAIFTSSAIVVAITFGCNITGYSVYAVLILALLGAYFAVKEQCSL